MGVLVDAVADVEPHLEGVFLDGFDDVLEENL